MAYSSTLRYSKRKPVSYRALGACRPPTRHAATLKANSKTAASGQRNFRAWAGGLIAVTLIVYLISAMFGETNVPRGTLRPVVDEATRLRERNAELMKENENLKIELRFEREKVGRLERLSSRAPDEEEARVRNAMLLQKCRDNVQSGTNSIRDLRSRNSELYEDVRKLNVDLKEIRADASEHERIAKDCQKRLKSLKRPSGRSK